MIKDFNPLVSIIIPVYNGSNYMKEAIDSALAQTYSNIEIIVINDGSNDGGETRKIALSYGNKIRYFEKENGGVSTALNLGIKNMRGDYFSWLSHDDLYRSDKVQKEIDAVRESGNPMTIVHCAWDVLYMPERIVRPYEELTRYSLNFMQSGLYVIVLGMVGGCTLLLHRNYFDKYGLFDENLRGVQDYKKWFEIFGDKKIIYLDKPYVIDRQHPERGTYIYKKMNYEENLLYMWIIDQVRTQHISTYPLSDAQFCSVLYDRARCKNLVDAQKKLLDLLKNTKVDDKNPRLFEDDCPIVLYCMGNNGKALCDILMKRNIPVSFFSDSNEKLWGTEYNAVKCIPPEEIDKSSRIIVTKDDASALVSKLKDDGFTNVTSYRDIAQRLMYIPIIK